jgi:hypothetical protein
MRMRGEDSVQASQAEKDPNGGNGAARNPAERGHLSL